MEMPNAAMSGGGGSAAAIEVGTLGAITLARLMQKVKVVALPALGSNVAIAAGVIIPTVTSGGVTTYPVSDELRVRHAHDQTVGHYERKVDGKWQPTTVTTTVNRDEKGEVSSFEGLSEADAEQLKNPYVNPAQAPLTTEPGGFQPHDGEDYSTMENRMPEAGMTGGPTGYPADTGVPVAGVMNNEGVENKPLTGTAKNAEWAKSEQGQEGPGLRDHFKKHGDQVGAKTTQEYDLSARQTIQNGRKFTYTDRMTGEPRVGYHDSETGLFTATSQTRKTPAIMTHFPETWSNVRKLPGFSVN